MNSYLKEKFLFSLLILSQLLTPALTKAQYWIPDWEMGGDMESESFGWSHCNAGDVNGDGYDDLFVGAVSHSEPLATEEEEGKLYLYYGGPDGLSLTPAWTYQPNVMTSVTGFDTGAGDLNGDGYSDLVAGCIQWTGTIAEQGRVLLFYGSDSGPSVLPDWEFQGTQVQELMGSSTALDGDINGDGYNDLFISAKMHDNPETNEGKVWGFYGSDSGPVGPVWSYESNQDDAIGGFPVSYAGDVDKDGYDDIIIGINAYDFDEVNDGLAVVFYGSVGGLSTTPDWQASSGQKKSNFGHWADGAGDVNGDGYDDVVVTALNMESEEAEVNEGYAFCYLGGDTGLAAEPSWVTQGGQAEANYGYCAAGAGDVNKDGFADVIVGAKYYENGEFKEGSGYLYFGSPDGLETDYCWMEEGNQDSAYYGRHVDGGGDFDNDGYMDFIASAYQKSFGLIENGKVEVYYGKPRESDWHFSNDSVCINDTNPVPVIDGMNGGNFTASPGLVFVNPVTGEVNLAASGVGIFEITYTFPGEFCAASVTHTLSIGAASDAAFTYASTSYINSPLDPDPESVLGAGASYGLFSATPAGLTFISTSTGQIDLSASAAGTYWVYNTVTTDCIAIDSFQVTIIQYVGITGEGMLPAIINLYPNPASDLVIAEIQNYHPGEVIEIQIIDNTGRVIKTEEIICLLGSEKKEIPIRNIEAGIYVVSFISEGRVLNKQIIIMNK
ncbi:MAG: FG-GAP repeat protein [Chitinophagales bacterium]|nr:FG-GAP repeat protein [Chitinophagales bacterium]